MVLRNDTGIANHQTVVFLVLLFQYSDVRYPKNKRLKQTLYMKWDRQRTGSNFEMITSEEKKYIDSVLPSLLKVVTPQ
jgi:hypothetical protein